MILKIECLTKRFGGIHAVKDCSLEIEREKITAIIGPNGSGKTTLFNLISKLLKSNDGHIHFNGKNITKLKDYEISKSGISRTFQDVRLFRNLTIKDHLEISLSNSDESIFKSLFKDKPNNAERIDRILKLVHLKKPLNTLVTDLSYGQRKLLDLAMAIAKPHSLLLLDEPVAGVNPVLREEIKEIIKNLNKNKGTILLIEHDMNFVMDLADYIFVMDAGKIIAHGEPAEIQSNKKVLEAYLGD